MINFTEQDIFLLLLENKKFHNSCNRTLPVAETGI